MTQTLSSLRLARPFWILLALLALAGQACAPAEATPVEAATPAAPAAVSADAPAEAPKAAPAVEAVPAAEAAPAVEAAPAAEAVPAAGAVPAAEAPAQEALAQEAAPSQAPVAAKPKGVHASVTDAQGKDFFDFIASHCYTDALGPTEYTKGWEGWLVGKDRDFVPKDAPQPVKEGVTIPAQGSPQAAERAAKLRSEWMGNPQSHIIDCRIFVEKRDCALCQKRGSLQSFYTAYLPKALFTNPEKVRAMLLMVPGGNGGRSRYFLTPIPNKTIFEKKSGGLEVKRHTDEYLAAHPDAVPPIMVAADAGGFLMVNGSTEYLSHDLPMHFATTFLGLKDLSKVAVGAEGISSGAKAMMEATRDKPDAFDVLGFTCMHCRRFNGIDPEKHFGSKEQRQVWLNKLKARYDKGDLRIRFSVGNHDNQWPCNKEFHTLFTEVGIFKNDPPKFGSCNEGYSNDPYQCTTYWDGFNLYNNRPHHYGLLLDSWVPQLQWHYETLTQMARHKNGQ